MASAGDIIKYVRRRLGSEYEDGGLTDARILAAMDDAYEAVYKVVASVAPDFFETTLATGALTWDAADSDGNYPSITATTDRGDPVQIMAIRFVDTNYFLHPIGSGLGGKKGAATYEYEARDAKVYFKPALSLERKDQLEVRYLKRPTALAKANDTINLPFEALELFRARTLLAFDQSMAGLLASQEISLKNQLHRYGQTRPTRVRWDRRR